MDVGDIESSYLCLECAELTRNVEKGKKHGFLKSMQGAEHRGNPLPEFLFLPQLLPFRYCQAARLSLRPPPAAFRTSLIRTFAPVNFFSSL